MNITDTILYCKSGSHAYGTNLPTSDEDFRGVFIPSEDYYIGLLKVEQEISNIDGKDVVIYELKKYIQLAADCNPNILELLFCAQDDVLWQTEEGKILRDNRENFLSKKARHTFSGYAMSQLKRIESHRRWLLNPPTHKPSRSEYGLPDRSVLNTSQLGAAQSLMRAKIDSWDMDLEPLSEAAKIEFGNRLAEILTEMQLSSIEDKTLAAGRAIGFDENFLQLVKEEQAYESRLREWNQYENWKENRNKTRSELEAKHGLDTKHSAHLVRLMRMCGEILEFGEVRVKREDAKELLEIRNGAWSYDKLIGWAKEQDQLMNELYAKSTLRHKPDTKYLNKLCCELVKRKLFND